MASNDLPAYSATDGGPVIEDGASAQTGSSSTVNIQGDGISTQLRVGGELSACPILASYYLWPD